MRHPNTKELEQFVNGKLPAEKLVELDEHISGCAECRAAISALPASKKSAIDLGAMLLGACDCPEYEELSAYVDNELGADQAKNVAAHVNLCELCSRDVSRIAQLRSHAVMRETVIVGPGMSKQRAKSIIPIWRRVLAGVAAGAFVVAAGFSFSIISRMSSVPVASVAKKPAANNSTIAKKTEAKTPTGTVTPKQPTTNNTVAKTPETVKQSIPAAPKALLKDGPYRVINQGGKMIVASAAGAPRTALEARVAASINQKLTTGKVKLVQMAFVDYSTITRAEKTAATSPIAAKLLSPSGKVLLSDRPTLKWSKVEMADSYRIRVYDATGEVVVDQVTDKTSLTLPTALPRGKAYKWQVGVRFSAADKWTESVAAMFGVLSSDAFTTIENVKRQLPGSHLALGAAYESFGLSEEAKQEYAAVKAANPGSSLARKLK